MSTRGAASSMETSADPVRLAHVYLLDDDRSMLRLLHAHLRSAVARVECFEDPAQFVERVSQQASCARCAVVDQMMPGSSGLEVLGLLAGRDVFLPSILLTAHADCRLTLDALQAGAVTVLEKPSSREEILRAVREAVCADLSHVEAVERRGRWRDLCDSLSPVQRDVLPLVLDGVPCKQVARELAISYATAARHKTAILAHMGVANEVELLRLKTMLVGHL